MGERALQIYIETTKLTVWKKIPSVRLCPYIPKYLTISLTFLSSRLKKIAANFKQVCQYYGNNFSTTDNNEQIKIGDIKVVKVDKDSPNTIFVKTSYQQEEFKNIIVGRKRSRTTSSFDIQNAYSK